LAEHINQVIERCCKDLIEKVQDNSLFMKRAMDLFDDVFSSLKAGLLIREEHETNEGSNFLRVGASSHEHFGETHVLIDIDLCKRINLVSSEQIAVYLLSYLTAQVFHEAKPMCNDV
jgi:hypothetical protein